MSRIRLARTDDAPGICSIYAPIVRDTVISFEVDVPDVVEITSRIEATLEEWPWLVCEGPETEGQGALDGYAYASAHRTRAAYRWSVDVSVYVAESARRKGVGRRLYAAIFEILSRQGYRNAYAGITLPNDGSVGLHESLGFEPVGVYREVGFKFDAWRDVGWWVLGLPGASEAATPVRSLNEVLEGFDWSVW